MNPVYRRVQDLSQQGSHRTSDAPSEERAAPRPCRSTGGPTEGRTHEADSSDESAALLAYIAPSMELPSGRRLEAANTDQGELVTVRSATGRLELRIRLTDAGPVLEMAAAQIQLRARGAVTVDCDRFDVRAANHIRLSSQGDIEEQAHGDKHELIRGESVTHARSVVVQATDGDLKLDAAEDLVLDGRKRVLINS